MLLIHGMYRLFPRRVAFRNDYCMACNAPQRAVRIRTFDVIHLNFIPLIPVGFRKRWTCCECGLNPHQLHLTRGLIKITTLVVLVFIAALFWILCGVIAAAIPADAPVYGLVGTVALLGAVAMAVHLSTWQPRDPRHRDLLRAVPPADDAVCPFCGTPMVDEFFECHCPGCGVRRL